jgi:DNA-binding NtrC family response regulator
MKGALCFGLDDIGRILGEENFKVDVTDDVKELINISKNYNTIIFNLEQGKLNKKKVFERLKTENNSIRIIGITSRSKARFAAKLLKDNLDDFLVRDSSMFKTKLKAIFTGKTNANAESANKNLDLFCHDPNMKKFTSLLEKIVNTKISILLEGEADCEHESHARAIHDMSVYKKGEFCHVFCPSLTKDILESMLFGKSLGEGESTLNLEKIKSLKNGTIFLENVDMLNPNLQSVLARFLETVEKNNAAGSSVRVISSSTRNLKEESENGSFKNELFYKINGFIVKIPPLRDNVEAIPALVKDLYQFYARQEMKDIRGITNRGLKLLEHHSWPGNIRELKNVIYNAIVVNSSGILDEDDFISLSKDNTPSKGSKSELTIELIDSLGNLKPLKDLENEAINRYVQYFNGNFTKASKYLGIGRATLYRKLEGNV